MRFAADATSRRHAALALPGAGLTWLSIDASDSTEAGTRPPSLPRRCYASRRAYLQRLRNDPAGSVCDDGHVRRHRGRNGKLLTPLSERGRSHAADPPMPMTAAFPRTLAWLVVSLCLVIGEASAGSFQVNPIRVEMGKGATRTASTVRNDA